MEDQRFDRLTRALAQPRTRRWTLGAVAAAVGLASRARSADAAFSCIQDGDWLGCGPRCVEGYRPGDCVCYDPNDSYCFDMERGAVCPNTHVGCHDGGSIVCRLPSGRNTCCPSGNWCDRACCGDGKVCAGARGCVDRCPGNAEFCGPSFACCQEGEQCIGGECQELDPCAAGRDGRGAAAAGVCCPPPHTQCGDQCCTGDQTCCGGGAHTTCCDRGKTCCPGANGVACCDSAETFCCSGVCCANHWTCVGGECRENCLGDRTNCGRNCCTKDQICFDPAQGICSDKCPQGQTACGDRECCTSNQECRGGTCAQKCSNGQKTCGKTCCGQNEQCKNGQCVKKKRASRRRKRK